MPGPAELSRGPLSPNACRGLGHWCWVSGQIGFSPGSPADAALLQGWPGGQKEASAPSSSWTPRGTWRPLSVVLDGGGPQVRAVWTPAHAGGHTVGSVMRELAPLAQQRAFLPVVGCCWGRGVAFSHPHACETQMERTVYISRCWWRGRGAAILGEGVRAPNCVGMGCV